MKKTFPAYGILGIILLVVSETFHLGKVEPFYSWFYCFAWWPYIFTIDAILYRLKGNSLFMNRRREFFLMIPWSVFIWLVFEAANLSLKNWYYINMPHSVFERWTGYFIAYGTVLPGLFETTELLETLGLFRRSRTRRIAFPRGVLILLVILGAFCLASSVIFPYYFFSLIWVGFIFLLEPFNYWLGGKSLLKDLEGGNPRKVYLLLVAGLICGALWEFWNYWSLSKWIYTVPFFEERKGFEMPFLGFLGFPPFTVEAYVMYNFLSLLRFKRGWEESASCLNMGKKTRPMTKALTTVFLLSFCVLVFRAIDLKTVDSYETRLTDAYWIDARYQKELPRVGITTLDEFLARTREKKEREELALRLLVPKEEMTGWVEKSQLVALKGLGVDNLRLLEGVGVHSVQTLTNEDPDPLYKKLRHTYRKGKIPREAKVRIWIREARKQVRNSH